ncbi:fimbrial assembly protein [Rhodoferax sp. 4810]|uniref:Fimbrial assembly protein n=1 Tax=Thiospirillum jenense TaxID=1653858 RepID=A0A839HBV5_9GAMM|nr:PilN domain-containing protein [Thiospirillum jenense]MBB1072968.1 fimbrial assembly protein [Rhodoferax jenense]MBB1124916.1 fimbrial assembly protein [Thiospirillum jenense]
MTYSGATPAQLLPRIGQAWRAALLTCLPPRLKSLLSRQPPRLVVCPAAGLDAPVAELWRIVDEQRDFLGELTRDGKETLAQLLPGTRFDWQDTHVELPAQAVLTRELQLPIQVKNQLHQTVMYEMNRLTPFQPAEVYFDVRTHGSVARHTKIAVTLALCRRDQLAPWLQRLRQAGAAPNDLTWIGAWPNANLLPLNERPRRRYLTTWMTTTLIIITFAFVTATLATPLWQKQQQHRALTKALRQIKRQADLIPALRTELEQARAGSMAVLNYHAQAARLTDLWRELTTRLPDDTWIQTLNYVNQEVDMRGQSAAATALIGLLEPAPGINSVHFSSPVMQLSNTGKERFQIAFTYRHDPPAPPPQ